MFHREWKEKYEAVDKEQTDTLEFSLRNKLIFRPDLTLPLTGNESMILPNAILMVST